MRLNWGWDIRKQIINRLLSNINPVEAKIKFLPAILLNLASTITTLSDQECGFDALNKRVIGRYPKKSVFPSSLRNAKNKIPVKA